MNSTPVIVHGIVRPDGSLELNQPVALPPGEVEVTVQPVAAPQQPKKKDVLAVLERIWAEREAMGLRGRSKEQIDADIQAMRDEWDERQAELERIRDQAHNSPE
jgi:hypothetical protein